VHAVVTLCRVLGGSPSGSWAWRRRQPSSRAHADERFTLRIRAIQQASRGTYGAPRIHAELASMGACCGRKRVARLLRRAGLSGCHRRRQRVSTTRRDPLAAPAPDRVERRVVATAPNQLWVADSTAVPTAEDFLYLAVILAVFSRRVVGWSMAEHLRAELVVGALELAVWNRHPASGVIHHSDHGCQSTSLRFGQH